MIDTRREPTFAAALPPAPAVAGRRRRSPVRFALPALALGSLAAGWLWLSQPEPELVVRPRAVEDAGAPAPEAQPLPAGERHPLQPLPAGEALRPGEIDGALAALLGRDAVLRFLQTTAFPRRAVATLDALGREHAPVAAWPVLPSPGRFATASEGGALVASPANAARYEAFVAFVDRIDAAQAVALYRRMYPVLQQAYRDLGFGDRPLNDRVLEVVELLLATPRPAQPPELALTEVKGPIAPVQPWTRYEYADPALEQLAAGQKILLRVGPENRRRLQAKLQEVRVQLLQASRPAAAGP